MSKDKTYILSYDEFRILLFSLGKTECTGILLEDKQFTVEDIIVALHHLTRMELLENKEDGFHLEPELGNIIKIIADPMTTEIVRTRENGPMYFSYLNGNDAVVSEKYWNKADCLRLRRFNLEEYMLWKEEVLNDHY